MSSLLRKNTREQTLAPYFMPGDKLCKQTSFCLAFNLFKTAVCLLIMSVMKHFLTKYKASQSEVILFQSLRISVMVVVDFQVMASKF